MIEHCEHILEYAGTCSSIDEFEQNTMLVEACVFNLVQLGELAHKELSDDLKASLQQIPWKQIYGLRNRIVHGYAGISMDVIWETITEDIQPLKEELQNSVQD